MVKKVFAAVLLLWLLSAPLSAVTKQSVMARIEALAKDIDQLLSEAAPPAGSGLARPGEAIVTNEAVLVRIAEVEVKIKSLLGETEAHAPGPLAAIQRLQDRLASMDWRLAQELRLDRMEARVATMLKKVVELQRHDDAPVAWHAAGKTVGAKFSTDAATRWDRVKEVLRRLFRAYTDKDVNGFTAQFADSAAQAMSVFRNAILEDFRQETEIAIDIELLQYRFSNDSVQVQFRWSRTSTIVRTGRPRVDAGVATYWLTRKQNYKVYQFEGRMPFGLNDAEVQKQTRTGQPNAQPTLNPDGSPANATEDGTVPNPANPPPSPSDPAPPAPPAPPGPPMAAVVNLAGFGLEPQPGAGNIVTIDLDTGTIRRFQADPNAFFGELPGEDITVSIPLDAGPGDVIRLGARNGSAIIRCALPAPAFSDLRNLLSPIFFGNEQNDQFGSFFGVRTTQGNNAFLNVPSRNAASIILGDNTLLVNPAGTVACNPTP